ncbi:heptaprenyl diphosphate synthase component 1 [Virgibacillus siamensis]|uniref:heptaprenyl diphosphate synthase component 1 n=1 Tax=Virgibacillus siamensis TaxID=480071 RepID=UPI00158B5357|nr:heptaprenyl diphosphate synthase component 1 [Virgibacillus siamensis]
MQTSDLDLNNFKSLIRKKMKHTYLDEYVQIPEINDDKLFILFNVLENTTLTEFQKENYIVTTMLVQMALDTHDLVPQSNEPEQTARESKAKQLSVLAGDYYSGLYYLILSGIEDIKLVHTLASAIKEINEYKMQLYYRESTSLEELLFIISKLDSLLIKHVADLAEENSISSTAADWLLTKKLLGIKNELELNGTLPSSEIYSDLPNYELLQEKEIINQQISNSVNRLKSLLVHFPLHLKPVKSSLVERLNGKASDSRIIVEEG